MITYIPIIVALIFGLIYGIFKFKDFIMKLRCYKRYKNTENEWGMTGVNVVAQMLHQKNFNTKIGIYKSKKKTYDPFYGNYYLPDHDVLVLKREIAHGKSVLSFAIAGQLSNSICEYKSGDLSKATFENGECIISYKFDINQIKEIAERTKDVIEIK